MSQSKVFTLFKTIFFPRAQFTHFAFPTLGIKCFLVHATKSFVSHIGGRHKLRWAQNDRTLQETFTFTDKRKLLLDIQIQEALCRKKNNNPKVSRK